jgi:hypothetical protein
VGNGGYNKKGNFVIHTAYFGVAEVTSRRAGLGLGK